MLRKLFPRAFSNLPANSFKLILASEGYLANETPRFIGDCVDLVEALFSTAPFGLTRMYPGWLSIYAGFTPSAQSGPAIDTAATANRTAFESSLTTATGVLALNQAKVNAWVAGESLLADSVEVQLDEFLTLGGRSTGFWGTLLVILLPGVAGQPGGGEAESTPGANDVHWIAVSKDGFYQQAIARAIASLVGLADEFELAGAANLQPSQTDYERVAAFNLEVFDAAPPSPIDATSQWYSLSGVAERTSLTNVHAKTNPAAPDLALDPVPARQPRIAFWEGGGGFRTKVWRSAHDCIMRRRFGDSALPLRAGKVSFCPACRYYLRGVIG